MYKLYCRVRSFRALMAAITLCLATAAFADARPLHGRVTNSDGQPLAGLTVKLFDPDAHALTAEYALATATTESNGGFTLGDGHTGELLVQVTGDDGAGRVLAAADQTELSVTYPVRTEIWLLHDNDHHFTFNYMGPFRDAVNEYREQYEDVFLLNAGDFFVRHQDRWHEPYEEHYFRRASGMIALMNAFEYDVATPGNHEFQYYGDFTRTALEMAEFPLVAANMEITTDKLPQFEDYTVLVTSNLYTIAVLGISTGGGMDGVTRHSRIGTAQQYRHLADAHALFVALTHIGVNTDRELAEAMPELDIIIGGHSHTLLEEAEMVNGVLVAQAGGHPHPMDYEVPNFLGIIRVVLENGEVVEKEGHVLQFGGEEDGGDD